MNRSHVPVKTFSVSEETTYCPEMRVATEDVMTILLMVGTLLADLSTLSVALIAGSIKSRL